MQIKYQLSVTVILAQPADYEICQSRQRVNLYGIAGPAEVRTSAGPVASHGEAAWIIQNRLKFCVTHATFFCFIRTQRHFPKNTESKVVTRICNPPIRAPPFLKFELCSNEIQKWRQQYAD